MYGDRANAKRAMYFIAGLSGVPGQVRFIFPSLTRGYGTDFFLKCCYLDEFSSDKLVWDKYTLENAEKRVRKIVEDIEELVEEFGSLMVFCSSTGFYEFVHAYTLLQPETIEKLQLVWAACAPDTFTPSPWEKVFTPLNGLEENGYKWWAFPNNNYLKWLNPEICLTHNWKQGRFTKAMYKHDLEVRFHALGTSWSYASTACSSAYISSCTKHAGAPIDIPTVVLAATNDGYWQGQKEEEMERVMKKYILNPHILFRDTSHLWITCPEYITEAIESLEHNYPLIRSTSQYTSLSSAISPALKKGNLSCTNLQ